MYTQKQINEGQKRINGALCIVDWYVIETLEALIQALADKKVLSRKDLEQINKAFQKAYEKSPTVAEIIPPGCVPRRAPQSSATLIRPVKNAA